MKASLFLLLSSLAVATALQAESSPARAPEPSKNRVVHERRDVSARSWELRRRVDSDVKLPVRIGLTPTNSEAGHDLLMDISNPRSANHRNYMSAQEVIDFFAPTKETVSAVQNWLENAGVDSARITQSTNKQWLQFDGAAEEVERLLQTKYYIYKHKSSGRTHLGCDQYHVPEYLSIHIDYITPGVKPLEVRGAEPKKQNYKRTFGFQNPRPPLLKALPEALKGILDTIFSDTICDHTITPACIKTLYNIPEGTTATEGNELGIFEDLADYFAQEDLDLFFTNIYPLIPNGTSPIVHGIDGGSAPINITIEAGPESDLDLQISYPIIWPQNSIIFQTDDAHYESAYIFKGFLNTFLDAIDGSYCSYSAYGITGDDSNDPPYPDSSPRGYNGSLQCGVYKPTNVISISYGGDESLLSPNYQKRQCNEYKKLGLQGITVLVASGDYGVQGAHGWCLSKNHTVFNPDFPAGCPYITTVGATYLPVGANATGDGEIATQRFASGGGFSNIYPQPAYQAHAVNAYLTQHTPSYKSYNVFNTSAGNNQSVGANGGVYNIGGRGYPDVSAVGDNVLIYNAGRATLIGGTSASAPLWGAILTRINEELLNKKRKTVGFVNPTLYAHPEVFHDITSGSNPGCGTVGFQTAPGWDPVTGLGTPRYDQLLALFLGE